MNIELSTFRNAKIVFKLQYLLFRSNFISYPFASFEVVAVKILLQPITSTWNSLQRPWHLYLICMKHIGIPILHTKTKLSFVRFMCCFILVLTANRWFVSIAFLCLFILFLLGFRFVLCPICVNIVCSGPRESPFHGGFLTCLVC